MSTPTSIAADAAAALLETVSDIPPVLIGFDGFIDSIMDVVDVRNSMQSEDYQPIRTIDQLSRRISGAAGRSMNLEIVDRDARDGAGGGRWGGNGPLLAGALARIGAPVTYIGAVGREDDPRRLHPVYEPFAALCERVVPIAAPGRTLAMEFDDGKVMLNEPRQVQAVTWERLIECLGGSRALLEMAQRAAVVGVVNWSLLGGVEGILRGLMEHVLVRIDASSRPGFFIDLTDPAKRTDEDVRGMVDLLAMLSGVAPVTLGVNLAEAERLLAVCGLAPVAGAGHSITGSRLADAAHRLREQAGLSCVVVHRRQGAAAALCAQGGVETAHVESAYTSRPRISTGAGDHFNGGFVLGRLLRAPLAVSLALGCAAAGFYVRRGFAPGRGELVGFLREVARRPSVEG